MSGHCKGCLLPWDFPCVRAGPEDRDEPKWWNVGPEVPYDWAGQGCGELETGPGAASPGSDRLLSHEQAAGISRGLGQQGLMVPQSLEPRLGERDPLEGETEPDTEEFECPRADWRDCNLPDRAEAPERGKERCEMTWHSCGGPGSINGGGEMGLCLGRCQKEGGGSLR